MLALTAHRSTVEVNDIIPIGNVAATIDGAGLGSCTFGAVEQLMLEYHDGVIVAHRCLEHAFGVVCVGRGNDLQARHADEEALHAAKSMKQVLIAEWGRIAYYDDEPVAFMIALPDINGMIGDLDGKLLPFGWVKFLWRLKINDIEGMRVPLMGILPEYQKKPVGAALALHMIEDVRLATLKRNLQRGELSWILEDNLGMRNIISRIESVVYKTYAIFEKSLLP